MGGPEFPYKYLLWHDIFRRANTINITTPHISGTVRDISTEFGLKVYDVILHHSFLHISTYGKIQHGGARHLVLWLCRQGYSWQEGESIDSEVDSKLVTRSVWPRSWIEGSVLVSLYNGYREEQKETLAQSSTFQGTVDACWRPQFQQWEIAI